MSLQVAVKRFTGPIGTDATFDIDNIEEDGVAFTPIAARFMIDRAKAVDTIITETAFSHGMCDSSITQSAVGSGVNSGGNATYNETVNGQVLIVRSSAGNGNEVLEAAVVSFGSGTCRLNFSIVNSSMDSSLITAIFYGGTGISSSVEEASVSAGEVTLMSFRPQYVVAQASALAADSKSNRLQLALGHFNEVDATIQQSSMGMFGGAGTSQKDLKWSVVLATKACGELRAGVIWTVDITAFTSDGFTWDGSDNSVIHFLCLFGTSGNEIISDISVIDKTTSGAPATQGTALPFNKPSLLEVGTAFKVDETYEAALSPGRTWSYGVWSEDDQTQQCMYSTDQNDATNRDGLLDSAGVIVSGDLNAVIQFDGVIQSTGPSPSSPPDFIFNPNTASAEKILIVALESNVAGAAPATPQAFFQLF